MTNEVLDLITQLRAGSMTLEEVADQFRQRSWPRTGKRTAGNYKELAAAAQEDPDPYVPGSFDDVTAAYHRGELSDAEYDTLAHAMAEAKSAS